MRQAHKPLRPAEKVDGPDFTTFRHVEVLEPLHTLRQAAPLAGFTGRNPHHALRVYLTRYPALVRPLYARGGGLRLLRESEIRAIRANRLQETAEIAARVAVPGQRARDKCGCGTLKSSREPMCLVCTYGATPARLEDLSGVATYFFIADERRDGAVKIGRTRNCPKRLQQLREALGFPTGRMARIIGGDFEAELHARFSPDRIAGEWFALNRALKLVMYSSLAAVAEALSSGQMPSH